MGYIKVRVLFPLIISLILIACNSKSSEVDFSPADQIWTYKDSLELNYVPVLNTRVLVKTRIEYTKNYPFRDLLLKETIITPNGDTSHFNHKINLFTVNGAPTGEKGFLSNQYSVDYQLHPELMFTESGKYTFRIKQYVRADSLPGIDLVSLKAVIQE